MRTFSLAHWVWAASESSSKRERIKMESSTVMSFGTLKNRKFDIGQN